MSFLISEKPKKRKKQKKVYNVHRKKKPEEYLDLDFCDEGPKPKRKSEGNN